MQIEWPAYPHDFPNGLGALLTQTVNEYKSTVITCNCSNYCAPRINALQPGQVYHNDMWPLQQMFFPMGRIIEDGPWVSVWVADRVAHISVAQPSAVTSQQSTGHIIYYITNYQSSTLSESSAYLSNVLSQQGVSMHSLFILRDGTYTPSSIQCDYAPLLEVTTCPPTVTVHLFIQMGTFYLFNTFSDLNATALSLSPCTPIDPDQPTADICEQENFRNYLINPIAPDVVNAPTMSAQPVSCTCHDSKR
jgi:hypothetical protein